MTMNVRNLLLASTAIGLMLAGPAQAADSDATIKALQAQMNALQKQLNELQAQQKAQAKAIAEAPAAPAEAKTEILPGVKVKVGGFIAADTIYRSKNQSADTASVWSAIPLPNRSGTADLNAHQSEFRASARNTRLSLLTEGEVDKDLKLTGYIESDFSAVGTSSNSVATNSYVPRLRQAFVQVDRNDWGLHGVIGQAWSLATMNSKGMLPRTESVPNVSDSGLLPGVVYTRNPQIRLVKDLPSFKAQAGIAVENPETSASGINTPGDVNVLNAGSASSMNTLTVYSANQMPDIVAKVAFDPGYGHYEVFGLARSFHALVDNTTNKSTEMAYGGGGGVGVLLPIVQKKLDFRGTFIAGSGIGRYTAGGLPDIALDPNGGIIPLTQFSATFGLIGRPTPTWELYVYGGFDKVMQENQAGNYGWGSSTNIGTGATVGNAVCNTTNGTANCQTSSLWQVTPGVWKELYKGNFGNIKVGAQYSLTRRNTFADANGVAPHAYQNVVLTSFRYSPF